MILALLLQLLCHGYKEGCAEEVHAHIAPAKLQLSCACTSSLLIGMWVLAIALTDVQFVMQLFEDLS